MKQQLYYVKFAQAYGQGSYSNCTYNDATTCTTSGGTGSNGGSGTSGTGGGGLADTGFAIALIVTIACVLIFAALVIRIWRRPSRKAAAETAQSDESRLDDTNQQN